MFIKLLIPNCILVVLIGMSSSTTLAAGEDECSFADAVVRSETKVKNIMILRCEKQSQSRG